MDNTVKALIQAGMSYQASELWFDIYPGSPYSDAEMEMKTEALEKAVLDYVKGMKKGLQTIEVGGKVLTKEDLESLRKEVIGWRDESVKQWPEAIQFTTTATHLIAVLYDVIKQYPEAEERA